MRYTIDKKRRIVDFFIEDDFGREVHSGMNFGEVADLIENLSYEMNEVLNDVGEQEMQVIRCDIHNVGKTGRTHVKCSQCGDYFDIPMDKDWAWTTPDYKPVCDDCAKIAAGEGKK